MPATVATVRAVPSAGSGRCNSNACSPCSTALRSKSPIMPTPPPKPSMLAKLGSTCRAIPSEFSVVNCRSLAASAWPAPTPSAYRSTSLDVQVRSDGGPDLPTLSRFRATVSPLRLFAGEDEARRGGEVHADALDEAGPDAGDLHGGLAAELPDRLLHREHRVHAGVGVGQAAAAGVHGQR